jgi:hypothetical protein
MPVLVFVAVCAFCGDQMEPCPAEGPGETWKSGEQWGFLAMEQHKPVCRSRIERKLLKVRVVDGRRYAPIKVVWAWCESCPIVKRWWRRRPEAELGEYPAWPG